MILAGDTQKFAIAAEITGIYGGWLLGRFRFIFHNRACGNWEDDADLRGCYGWLKDFFEKSRDRFEPGLFELPAVKVYERLIMPVFSQPEHAQVSESYQNTFDRFQIGHLGMSSFDNIAVVLIENAAIQRCVWIDWRTEEILEDTFPAGEMQRVAAEFCKLLKAEAAELGFVL